jgi:hypothetical protein
VHPVLGAADYLHPATHRKRRHAVRGSVGLREAVQHPLQRSWLEGK